MGGLSDLGMPKMPDIGMPSLNMKMPELKMPGVEMSHMKLPDMVICVLAFTRACVPIRPESARPYSLESEGLCLLVYL